jgi:hypothetical protein
VECSNDWEKMCILKTVPNWKELGKKLGKDMKNVAKAVNALTQAEIVSFMHAGKVELCGYELTTEEIVVKREFSGDAKKYEAAVSDDGSLLVAIDTTCDAAILQELRSRTVAAAVQKLRKSSGLVVADRVEVFYEEKKGTDVAAALAVHAEATIKRIRCLPLSSAKFMPANALVVAKEVIEDADISKGKVTLWLTRPTVSVAKAAIAADFPDAAASVGNFEVYLQSMDYDRIAAMEAIEVTVDGVRAQLRRNKHYFASAGEFASACPAGNA